MFGFWESSLKNSIFLRVESKNKLFFFCILQNKLFMSYHTYSKNFVLITTVYFRKVYISEF